MVIEDEEEARLVKEERLKAEEQEEDLRLKDEEEAQLTDGTRMKLEENENAWLKVEEGVRLTLEMIQRAEEQKGYHTRLKAEQEAHLV